GVVALGSTDEILVELLVRIVEPVLADGQPNRIILAHDRRIPLGRVDGIERAVDIDVLQLVDQQDRWIAIGGDIARCHGYWQPLVGAIAEFLHNLARFGAVLLHIRSVSWQSVQYLWRHAPGARGR